MELNEPTKYEILSDPIISYAIELFDGTLEGCVTPDMKVYRTKNSKLAKPSPEYIESFPNPILIDPTSYRSQTAPNQLQWPTG